VVCGIVDNINCSNNNCQLYSDSNTCPYTRVNVASNAHSSTRGHLLRMNTLCNLFLHRWDLVVDASCQQLRHLRCMHPRQQHQLLYYTVSQKNIPDVFSYNSRKHCRIFIIFGRNISKKACNRNMLYFSTSPN